jgi:tetratricopeptide (TPR) repeat protein
MNVLSRRFIHRAAAMLLVLCGIVLAPTEARAQEDLELAEYYYNQGQFEQARLYYDKIYKTNKTNRVYTNYLNTLIALDAFEEAEQLVKKKLKTDSEDGTGYVQLGELYKRFNKAEDAKAEFERALSKFNPTRSNAIRLANEFTRINEYQYALRVYEKARQQSRDGYTYTFEIANMQGNLGDFESMTESFLDLVAEEPNYLQTVQNSLNRTLNFSENPEQLEMLKGKLLKRSQKFPEQTIYTEMLTWLFMQKKDFASAFVQASALDKRLAESGSRIINLAQLAFTNKDYATARKSYQYVIDKGPMNPFYITARMEKLQVMSAELADKPGIDKAAYGQLEQEYLTTLQEVGRNGESAMMIKELAHIQAFFLDKSDNAIANLREALALPGMYAKTLALIKLELADILLFNNEVWDASLLYSQVELDFKDDVLGNEAKFRNARISYYTGDFEWAQGQLDALKASTTKLISNDAIDLSLLITDNFNMDTTTVAMEMFARADLLAFRNRTEQCFITLDSILTQFPMHSLTDEIYMLKAKLYFRNGDFTQAKAYYQRVVDQHFTDITADDALFRLAEMADKIDGDSTTAMALYEKLITEFPGSLFVVEARKRYRELRGDTIN